MPYAPLLDEAGVATGLGRLEHWRQEGNAIVREDHFATFPAAIAFVGRVAELAEEADHHPDIDIRWRRVRLRLTTHASGGLTARDFDLATLIDGVIDEMASGTDRQPSR